MKRSDPGIYGQTYEPTAQGGGLMDRAAQHEPGEVDAQGLVSCLTRGCPSRSTNPRLRPGSWMCPTCRHEAGLDGIRSLPLELRARLNGLDGPIPARTADRR
jgi:hypothetical protein